MISPADFYDSLQSEGIDFFTGVPDSLLKDFCAYLEDNARINIITANEGNSIGLAAGHYLASGKPALVYMQNSGIGNAVNPLVSLMDEDVYKIPTLLLIGWRGEPGVQDEPQHKKQGKITLSLLECMGIDYLVVDDETSINTVWKNARPILKDNKPYALVIKKGVFEEYKLQNKKEDLSSFSKERAIELILSKLEEDDMIVSTTGKTSRELFELRKKNSQGHKRDFLTVGSMGHTSQIAMGVSLSAPEKTIYCLDGDGSVLMHMGSLIVNGTLDADNFRHIVFNNGAHDSVGGQPTSAASVSLSDIAKSCGCGPGKKVENEAGLLSAMEELASGEIRFLEVLVKKGSRKDLGRPTVTPQDCKKYFMEQM